MRSISIAVPVYNEGSNIHRFISSLVDQLKDIDYKLYFCLNGCTDESEELLFMEMKLLDIERIKICYSQKGKTYAQNAIIKEIVNDNRGNYPILFLDADILIGEGVVTRLYEELFRVPSLKAVGALTCPIMPSNIKFKSIFYILNIRNMHPLSQIAQNSVIEYKTYVDEYPQHSISPENEKITKIFFHGRCFMLKEVNCFSIPENEDMVDDTYLPNYIHYKYGPSTIRIVYDAVVYYKAYMSFVEHFKTYRRINYNIKKMDSQYPAFYQVRHAEQLKMNWKYIVNLSFQEILFFVLHVAWIRFEHFVYKILPEKKLEVLWEYDRK